MSKPKKEFEANIVLKCAHPVSDPLLGPRALKIRITEDDAKRWNTCSSYLNRSPMDLLVIEAADGCRSISFLRQDLSFVEIDEVPSTESTPREPVKEKTLTPPSTLTCEQAKILRALERRDDLKTNEFDSLPRNAGGALALRQIDLNAMNPAILEEGQDLLRILVPYLPALQRASEEVYEGFIKHFNNREWEQIDSLLYAQMTNDERNTLLDAVNQDARDAALARFNRTEMTKELAWKILTNLLTKLL